MFLRFNLLDQSVLWQYSGSREIDDLITSLRWRDRGGVYLLQTESEDSSDDLHRQLSQFAKQVDAGLGDVRFISESDGFCSFVGLASESLQVDLSNEREAILAAAKRLEQQPYAFFLKIPASEIDQWYEDARRYTDLFERAGCERLPAVFLVTSGDDRLTGNVVDFKSGNPVFFDLWEQIASESHTAWKQYLVLRLAWESAGSAQTMRKWIAENGIDRLSRGNDTALEAKLNAIATSCLSSIPNDQFSDPIEMLDRWSRTRDKQTERSLAKAGLLWRPAVISSWLPKPWVSRAFLSSLNYQEPQHAIFRLSLICPALRDAVASACAINEARLRVLSHDYLPKADVIPAEMFDRLQDFSEGKLANDRDHYPKDCPSFPTDPWVFATIGELLKNLNSEGERRLGKAGNRLRRLRNMVAHGHYVSWHAIEELAAVDAELS